MSVIPKGVRSFLARPIVVAFINVRTCDFDLLTFGVLVRQEFLYPEGDSF